MIHQNCNLITIYYNYHEIVDTIIDDRINNLIDFKTTIYDRTI